MSAPQRPNLRPNASYVEEMYARFQADPRSVPEDWAWFLAGFDLGGGPAVAATGGPSAGGFGLLMAYREFGHLIARLDPLSEPPASHPLLELSTFGLSPDDLDRVVDVPFADGFHGTLRDLVAALRETYCGTLGAEFMDIRDKARRDWLQERMERRRNRPDLTADDRVRILEGMPMADAFEQFLHVRYLGQKRCSLEGAARLCPMIQQRIDPAAALNVEQIVFGMPHRGRLNVLANVLGKPLERVFGEFESNYAPEEVQDHGDVKYHLGFSTSRETR